jgi:hypothetical protein
MMPSDCSKPQEFVNIMSIMLVILYKKAEHDKVFVLIPEENLSNSLIMLS